MKVDREKLREMGYTEDYISFYERYQMIKEMEEEERINEELFLTAIEYIIVGIWIILYFLLA